MDSNLLECGQATFAYAEGQLQDKPYVVASLERRSFSSLIVATFYVDSFVVGERPDPRFQISIIARPRGILAKGLLPEVQQVSAQFLLPKEEEVSVEFSFAQVGAPHTSPLPPGMHDRTRFSIARIEMVSVAEISRKVVNIPVQY